MTYSCCDFTDDVLNALEINVPVAFCDSPSDQADLAIAEIERLQAGQRGLAFDNEETAIILAGLRTIQRVGVAAPEEDIATDGGAFDVMTDDDIDSLCERLNAAGSLTSAAYPISALATDWTTAAESHRDAMRAAGTTTDGSLDEQKARAAAAVAAALGKYAELIGTPPPAALTDWHAIATGLAGALAGAVDQIGQMKGMFDDKDGAIQTALDDADEALARYSTPPAMPAQALPVIVAMEGGLCQIVVSHDPAMIGKPYVVVDYDTEGSDDVSQVLQDNGKHADAVIGAGIIERATITLPNATPATV